MAFALLAALFFCGNANAAATTYTVNATTDTGTGSGSTGDLRYAITQAELAANAGSTIDITATGTITLTSALPAITQDTTITGPGAGKLTVSGANAYQVFSITTGTVAISGLTIANGNSSGLGAGIQNQGTLTVSGCVFTGGSALDGGGISSDGTLIVTHSTFLRNASSSTGGAIYGNTGTVNVTNSTFYANPAGLNGGAIYQATGTLTVANSTFFGNTAVQLGGALSTNTSVTLDLVNNVFAAGSAPNYGGISTSATTITESNNLFFNNSNGDASFTLSGTDVSQDPKLLPLGNYGGTTPTMLPQPGSPAVCTGSVSYAKDASGTALTADQRGFSLNAANCTNGGVDMGAVQTNYLMVITATDTDNGSCTSATCSLRDAITAANTAGGDIGFKSSLNGSTITLASALPAITGAANVIGPGADELTVSGGGSTTVGSVFVVNSGAEAVFYGLTITDGAVSGDGGGVNNSGTLTVLDSAVSGNTASSGVHGGGGIYSVGTLTVTRSTISGNTEDNDFAGGGGILNNTGTLTVTDSTISGNSTGDNGTGDAIPGGGISTIGGTLTVTNSTISGNSSVGGIPEGGGIWFGGGGGSLANSIVAGNTGGDIQNSYTDKGGNLVGTSGINLAALGSYGGPMQTMLPLPGSPALCAGSSSLAVDANGNALTTDQRGFAMGAASYCASGSIDAGAVQTNYTSTQFTNDTFGTTGVPTYSALINQAVTPAPIVSVTENGQNVGGVPLTLIFTPATTGTATGLGPVTTVAGTGATFSTIKVDTAGASDTLGVSLPVGSSSLTASANLEIDGAVGLSPASGALTGGSVGTAYSKTISGTGGKSPYTYALATGTLPDGVTLNTSTGVLSGTPTTAGNFTFSIQVTDKKSRTGSASYTLAVAQALTSIAVSSKDTTTTSEPSGASFVGDSVTFTASLTPVGSGVTFSKSMAFTLDGAAVAACSAQTVTVASDGSTATATCAIANLTKGAHTIVASYPTGDSNYAAATSANFTQTVSLSATSVVVSSNKNPSKVDDAVTLTATITNTSGTTVPSAGTVAFTSDGVGISGCGSVALVAGTSSATASCPTSSLAASATPHSIVATYSGDGTTYDTSASSAFSQTVNKGNTAVAVTSSGASGVNQQVTFTAAVTPISPVALSATGTVSFTDNGTAISGCSAVTITAATGQATCSTAFLSAVSHVVSAIYNGDSNYNATAAGSVTTVTQTVTKATTSVALASLDNTTSVSGTSSSLNDSVTFTATVTPYNGATALTPPFTGAASVSGTVSFTSNGHSLCSTSVGVDGAGNYSATCATSTLPAGSNNIVATYSGNAGYSGSNNSLSQSVATVATATAVTSSSGTSTVNQTVTFTASVTPFNAATALSGSVTFTATNTSTSATTTLCNAVSVQASTGAATCAASSLTPGSYTVTASYGSDSNYNASSGSVSQTVGQATTSISLASSPNPSTVNQKVTLTATVTAPSGANTLNGSVTFTDNGAAISDCPATAINPNNPTVTCKTSSLALGANSIIASYGADANFSNSSSTAVSQTVNAAPTTTSITSSAGTTTVDQAVSFTATVSGTSGAVQFAGAMSFTDNGAAIPGCSSINVGSTTGSAVCTTSSLAGGTHTIAASYAGDTNFSASESSLTQKVNPGASSTTLVSSLNPSIALNPNNYQDTVNLTATVSPSAGVPLSGAVTFTDNGAPIAECQSAIPVNPASGTASCVTASLLSGSHTILAVYNGDPNFNSSSGMATQSVQDYTLVASPTSSVTVSQRFTNTTDLFSPQPITVAATPIAGFTGNLSLTCSIVPLSAPSGAVPPACTLASSSTSIIASGQQQPVAVTIDAGTGATPVATAGTYNVSITGVDQTTGLTHATASFVVNVRYQAPPLTMVSGATSGNTTTVGFSLPANVGLTDIICASVTGPTLTSSVAPVALSMGCTFTPSTVPPTSTSQDVVVTVAVSTGAATTARLDNSRTAVTLAGLFAVPILAFLGFMPGPKSRKVFFRYLGIVIAAALLFTGTGCGGGSFTAPPSVSGQTPPGSYNILVQGTGTDHQTYQAVIQVNVTR